MKKIKKTKKVRKISALQVNCMVVRSVTVINANQVIEKKFMCKNGEVNESHSAEKDVNSCFEISFVLESIQSVWIRFVLHTKTLVSAPPIAQTPKPITR